MRFIVDRKFEALFRIAPESRVKITDFRNALSDYGGTVVMPPEPIETLLNVIEVRNSKPVSWSIQLPMWTREEGRSDLTLEMQFTESKSEFYEVEIDDLHVL